MKMNKFMACFVIFVSCIIPMSIAEEIFNVTVFDADVCTNTLVVTSDAIDLNNYEPDRGVFGIQVVVNLNTSTVSSVVYELSNDNVTFAVEDGASALFSNLMPATGTVYKGFTPAASRYIRFKATAATEPGIVFTAANITTISAKLAIQ